MVLMRLEDPNEIDYSETDLDAIEYLDDLDDLDVSYSNDIKNLLRAMLSADPNSRKLSYTYTCYEGASGVPHHVRVVLGIVCFDTPFPETIGSTVHHSHDVPANTALRNSY